MATIYKITTPVLNAESKERAERGVAWAPSMGAARKERRRLSEEHTLKLNDVEIELVDVPSGKAGLIGWLNQNFTRG